MKPGQVNTPGENHTGFPVDTASCNTVQDAVMDRKGLEKPANSLRNQCKTGQAAAKSGAVLSTYDFASAIAAVMSLPLSVDEKAECVRRLLAEEPI